MELRLLPAAVFICSAIGQFNVTSQPMGMRARMRIRSGEHGFMALSDWIIHCGENPTEEQREQFIESMAEIPDKLRQAVDGLGIGSNGMVSALDDCTNGYLCPIFKVGNN